MHGMHFPLNRVLGHWYIMGKQETSTEGQEQWQWAENPTCRVIGNLREQNGAQASMEPK